jgi:hypothetical protein
MTEGNEVGFPEAPWPLLAAPNYEDSLIMQNILYSIKVTKCLFKTHYCSVRSSKMLS